MTSPPAFLAMKVSALTVDPLTGVPLAILTDDLSGTAVPVGIGLGEASAIAAELDDIDLERPMTHQLMSELLRAAGARVVRVELREMTGGESSAVVSATVALELADGTRVEREGRPSDALALALRSGAPIWVEVSVVEKLSRSASPWALGLEGTRRAPVRRRRRGATAPVVRAAETMPDAMPEDSFEAGFPGADLDAADLDAADLDVADLDAADMDGLDAFDLDGVIDDHMLDDLADAFRERTRPGGGQMGDPAADHLGGERSGRDALLLEHLGPEAFGKWKM